MNGSTNSAATAAPRGQKYQIQVLDRALRLLGTLRDQGRELTLTELSNQLTLHKSTVHRLLAVLERSDFVERDPRTCRYKLGLRLFELGFVARANLNLAEKARPYLDRLAAESGESAHIAIPSDGQMLALDGAESLRGTRLPPAAGRRYPMYCTSAGKAVLAFSGETEVRRVLTEQPLRSFTGKTITSLAKLQVELDRVRRTGYALDDEEYEEGLRCLGAPVRDCSRQVVGAIGIAGPTSRVTKALIPSLSQTVIVAARDLSRLLGYRD